MCVCVCGGGGVQTPLIKITSSTVSPEFIDIWKMDVSITALIFTTHTLDLCMTTLIGPGPFYRISEYFQSLWESVIVLCFVVR